jgi:hypothetical protein
MLTTLDDDQVIMGMIIVKLYVVEFINPVGTNC